jgi:hypothetical protein
MVGDPRAPAAVINEVKRLSTVHAEMETKVGQARAQVTAEREKIAVTVLEDLAGPAAVYRELLLDVLALLDDLTGIATALDSSATANGTPAPRLIGRARELAALMRSMRVIAGGDR